MNTTETVSITLDTSKIYNTDYTKCTKRNKVVNFASDILFRSNGSGYVQAMTGLPVPANGAVYFLVTTEDGVNTMLANINDTGRLAIRNPVAGSNKTYWANVTYICT